MVLEQSNPFISLGFRSDSFTLLVRVCACMGVIVALLRCVCFEESNGNDSNRKCNCRAPLLSLDPKIRNTEEILSLNFRSGS